MAFAGMEPEVRDAIREPALAARAAAARPRGEEIVVDGSVLIASGRLPGEG